MILGIGSDILSVSRIEKVYNKWGINFVKKILTDKEIVDFNKILSKYLSLKAQNLTQLGRGRVNANNLYGRAQELYKYTKLMQSLINSVYERIPKLYRCNQDSKLSIYQTKDNLIKNDLNKEIDYYYAQIIIFLAKKWSAKESIAKAIGTGIGEYCKFSDMEIAHDKLGKPIVYLSDKVLKYLATVFFNSNQTNLDLKKYQVLLSISDESDKVLTFAVLSYNAI